METEILKWLTVGGTPGTVVIFGFIAYRWTASRFDRIETALDCKQSKEMCDEKHEAVDHNINRLEAFANGALKK